MNHRRGFFGLISALFAGVLALFSTTRSSLFMAGKYLRPQRSFVSLVPVIAVLGVAVGVMVMIVVLGVMSGFGKMWKEKLTEFKPHIQLQAIGSDPLYSDDTELIDSIQGIEGVMGVSPTIVSMVVAEQYDGGAMPAYVRGANPELEAKYSPIAQHLKEGRLPESDGEVVLGRDLAQAMGTWIGDDITVFSTAGFAEGKDVKLPEELFVVGIFSVGMHEIDGQWMLSNLDTARDIANMEEGVSSYLVRLNDPYEATGVQARIDQKHGLDLHSSNWIQQNRMLMAALDNEKSMMFLVMIVVSIVAAFGIINTLITLSYQKTHDIGLMRALGWSQKKILGVFVWVGVILGTIGVALGTIGGLLVLHYRNSILELISRIRGVELFPKEMYSFEGLPATIQFSDVALIAGVSLLFSIGAALLTATRAVYMNPVDALRND